MPQTPESREFIRDYLKNYGFGLTLPASLVRPAIVKTGDVVRDYIAAAGYGLPKHQKP